jgi:hypothetical protein
MTPAEHRARHVLLHRMFDELMADWLGHTGFLPPEQSLVALMEWSYTQTLDPTEPVLHPEESE